MIMRSEVRDLLGKLESILAAVGQDEGELSDLELIDLGFDIKQIGEMIQEIGERIC